MASNHKTARGLPIDMDRLRLANETTIAVGNMKVNARGDQLGQGGKVIKTRAQIMNEKNKLHGPMADDFEVLESSNAVQEPVIETPPKPMLQPTVEHDVPVAESSATPAYVKPRGSFADSVAKETEVTQELLDPSILPGSKPTGVQRI